VPERLGYHLDRVDDRGRPEQQGEQATRLRTRVRYRKNAPVGTEPSRSAVATERGRCPRRLAARCETPLIVRGGTLFRGTMWAIPREGASASLARLDRRLGTAAGRTLLAPRGAPGSPLGRSRCSWCSGRSGSGERPIRDPGSRVPRRHPRGSSDPDPSLAPNKSREASWQRGTRVTAHRDDGVWVHRPLCS
jgi:hypothetical protein